MVNKIREEQYEKVVVDAGLRAYLLSVYNYMSAGLLVSAIFALGTVWLMSGWSDMEIVTFYNSGSFIFISLAPLFMLFGMRYLLNQPGTSVFTIQMMY